MRWAWWRGLLARLVAASALVAVCSVTATAWLAARSTSGTIRHQQGQTLARDAHINDALLGWAATHSRWDGVGSTVTDLARRTGRRITLMTEGGALIADSAASRPPQTRPSAVVDPLAVDVSLVPGAPTDRIDARATGPYLLPLGERATLRRKANDQVACLRSQGEHAEVATSPTGRPFVQITPGKPGTRPGTWDAPPMRGNMAPGAEAAAWGTAAQTPQPVPTTDPRPTSTKPPENPAPTTAPRPSTKPPVNPAPPAVPSPTPSPLPRKDCAPRALEMPTPTERKALAQLKPLVVKCLKHDVMLWLNAEGRPEASGQQDVASCLASARREQLKPYVAAPALLFITTPDGETTPGISLSRLAAVTLVVLVLAVGVSVLIATRLVRPVRAITAAAQRMRGGDTAARVTVRTNGEIGELAAAFNEMSEHLDRLERQRKAMVSDVSHELRTPLSNVRGWLEAVQDGIAPLDPELTASLVEETMLLQHIVDDLQQLALADAGKLRLHPEPVAVAEIFDQIAAAYRSPAEAADVTIVRSVSSDLTMTADPVRLRQAIGNLVANALRYTPPGGRVTLRAYRESTDVVIEVRDTGSGIDPAHLPYVFDRFWRAEKSRSRRTGGSGLGLAIVRDLTLAHGGTASADSAAGHGATFTLRFPAGP